MNNKSDNIKDVAISLGAYEALLYLQLKEFYQKEGEVVLGSTVTKAPQDVEKDELRRLYKG